MYSQATTKSYNAAMHHKSCFVTGQTLGIYETATSNSGWRICAPARVDPGSHYAPPLRHGYSLLPMRAAMLYARTLSLSPWASARSIASGCHLPLSFSKVEAMARKPCAVISSVA